MRRIFVCAGLYLAKNKNINKQAGKLGKMLAEYKDIIYVQGGSITGLMGETLKAFYKQSKNVEFLIPDTFYENDSKPLIKLVGEENFKATKTRGEAGRLEFIRKCDEIIVMPGGTGTLEELLYCNETSRAGEHSKKITIVNIDGFYNGLLEQINMYVEQGLTPQSAIKFDVVNNVDEIKLL